MILVQNTIVSDELYLIHFCCHLEKCRGDCCVEGDAGAPLEDEEVNLLEDHIDEIVPFMTDMGVKTIRNIGVFEHDQNRMIVTPLVDGLECAFANFENGMAYCAIERACEEGRINFHKPLSCHLYPIRISKLKDHEAVNYHKWVICKPALKKGKVEGVPLYEFCRDALIRKYGKEWYEELRGKVEERGAEGK